MFGKRGLSPVIAVVLLVMITIIAASIIIAFVIPFVNDNLGGSGECFDVLGDLSFSESVYTCSIVQDDVERTGFSVRTDNEEISGIGVNLIKEGSSDSLKITDGVNGSELETEIRMLSGNFSEFLSVPGNGGVRTYVAKGIFEGIEIYPILKSGRTCDIADRINPVSCQSQEAIELLTAN